MESATARETPAALQDPIFLNRASTVARKGNASRKHNVIQHQAGAASRRQKFVGGILARRMSVAFRILIHASTVARQVHASRKNNVMRLLAKAASQHQKSVEGVMAHPTSAASKILWSLIHASIVAQQVHASQKHSVMQLRAKAASQHQKSVEEMLAHPTSAACRILWSLIHASIVARREYASQKHSVMQLRVKVASQRQRFVGEMLARPTSAALRYQNHLPHAHTLLGI